MTGQIDGDKLRRILRQRKKSGEDIAKQAGISRSAFSRILNGKAVARRKNAERIAAALGVPLSELAPDEDNPRTAQESELLRAFRKLDEIGRSRVLALAADLAGVSGGAAFDARLAEELQRPPDRARAPAASRRRKKRAGA
ncbi:MAG: helix-turn-helix transcriptional regulator [Planctomycetes bacterium]|nr:helix-turn-helix transcriptional regulator [Planctomycetota bacterium]